jgi:hypothetical protein
MSWKSSVKNVSHVLEELMTRKGEKVQLREYSCEGGKAQ